MMTDLVIDVIEVLCSLIRTNDFTLVRMPLKNAFVNLLNVG